MRACQWPATQYYSVGAYVRTIQLWSLSPHKRIHTTAAIAANIAVVTAAAVTATTAAAAITIATKRVGWMGDEMVVGWLAYLFHASSDGVLQVLQ